MVEPEQAEPEITGETHTDQYQVINKPVVAVVAQVRLALMRQPTRQEMVVLVLGAASQGVP
jgi:hypothetical protein